MSLATAPSVRETDQLHCLIKERDHWRATAYEAQQKLSAVAAAIQNPALTWKERGARVAVALALEAQRPDGDPTGAFRVDLGSLAKSAGLIPPTPAGDEEARSKGWKSGRKLAGQVLKEFADVGVIESRSLEKERDHYGTVVGAGVVVQIERPHVDVIRAVSKAGGTRKLQAPRGASRPVCPDCGPEAPVIERRTIQCFCGSCGQALTEPDVRKNRLEPEPDEEEPAGDDFTGFQRLETLYTKETTGGVEAPPTEFQRLELGSRDELEVFTNANGANLPLGAALAYAAAGRPVFPCNNDKEPLTGEGGFHKATTDREQILEWWRKWPDALIGAPVRPGEIVIDVDREALGSAEHNTCKRAGTLTQRSRSGGYHYVFSLPPGVSHGNSVGKLPAGIHVRGAGAGYIIMAPSPGYEWVRIASPVQIQCEMLALIQPPPEPPRPRSVPPRSTGWLPPTRRLLKGQRDGELTRYAAAMASKCGMSEDEIFDELQRIRDKLCEYVPDDPITDASLRAKARSAVRKAGSAGTVGYAS